MLGWVWVGCKMGVPYKEMKPKCSKFEPTITAIQTDFLHELYNNFISYNNIVIDPQFSSWRILVAIIHIAMTS